MEKEIRLAAGPEGVFHLAPEPFAVIEVATKEDFERLQKIIQLGMEYEDALSKPHGSLIDFNDVEKGLEDVDTFSDPAGEYSGYYSDQLHDMLKGIHPVIPEKKE